mmetsp:Transcript_29925/g.65425  ORF Transcript_29925/g.65425 Transcript_29925/m.65425 type:complete len:213 (-) Transcript_29925:274-912(-)
MIVSAPPTPLVIIVPTSALFVLIGHRRGLVTATGLRVQLVLDDLPVPATAHIVVRTVLVAHLPTALASPELPALYETPIDVHTDWPLVQDGTPQNIDTAIRVLSCIVNYEAKPTRLKLAFVQTDDDPLHISNLREKFHNLLLSREERQVAYVNRGGSSQAILVLLLGPLKAAIAIGRKPDLQRLVQTRHGAVRKSVCRRSRRWPTALCRSSG